MQTKLKVAGYVISIEKDGKILPNESRIGEYSSFEQKIKLADGLSKQQEEETLIHETLEAINDIYELGLDHDEQLCKLSVAIHQIFVDNKKLINDFCSCDLPKFFQR